MCLTRCQSDKRIARLTRHVRDCTCREREKNSRVKIVRNIIDIWILLSYATRYMTILSALDSSNKDVESYNEE